MNNTNEYHRDSTVLDHGSFSFFCNVRAASEALIWTNMQNKDFDDQSVIRFILSPGAIQISKIDGIKKATITGSPHQDEKEKWDHVKSSQIDTAEYYFQTLRTLVLRKKQTGHSDYAKQIDSLGQLVEAARGVITKMDVGYIASHPESYLSGYLLGKRCRRIPVDSVKLLYNALADSVKNSSVGYEVLSYVYPLTNDTAFRAKNPLFDQDFNKQLAGIRSIHDFKLQDLSGKWVDFTSFKGKYLVIDMWASWCGPCIKTIPAWNKLIPQYNPKLIQFITVSMDTEVDAWKRSIAQHKPGGSAFIEPRAFNSLFAVYCKALWVSHYVIADPTGHILNYDAPHPDNPKFKQIIDNLIK
ncbi:thiol-disulfide isomerase/thioredoxin [Chitinophagaceae bacterium OAS944]|nr:thiol-disulfide isomerase/thioredoxin [Chitinophagaceae bacterium OAS944]